MKNKIKLALAQGLVFFVALILTVGALFEKNKQAVAQDFSEATAVTFEETSVVEELSSSDTSVVPEEADGTDLISDTEEETVVFTKDEDVQIPDEEDTTVEETMPEEATTVVDETNHEESLPEEAIEELPNQQAGVDVTNPTRELSFYATWGDKAVPEFGDLITLHAELSGYEGLKYIIRWEVKKSADDLWQDLGDDGETYTLTLTEENLDWLFRVAVDIVGVQ